MGKRVQVTFNDDQWKVISTLKGIMGDTDADIVRNIVLSWLAEKSIVSTIMKSKITGEKDEIRN